MTVVKPRLQTNKLYRALDVHRRRSGLSWRAVAEAVGVDASLFTRLSRGTDISLTATNLRALAQWLGKSSDDFFEAGELARPEHDGLARLIEAIEDDRRLPSESADAMIRIVEATYGSLPKHDD